LRGYHYGIVHKEWTFNIPVVYAINELLYQIVSLVCVEWYK
jgi:hypothetical protein